MSDGHPRALAWIDALHARHTASLTRAELLKAIRALSARYVERRGELPRRSPIDSAGKRAAFAAFYAPLHFFTVDAILKRLDALAAPAPPTTILDLGCGTGVAGAAWALAAPAHEPPALTGIDRDRWALDEARWNWSALDLRGSARRGDLVAAAAAPAGPSPRRRPAAPDAIVLGWSANELPADARASLLTSLLARHANGARVLVVEPIARRAAPWWDDWRRAFERAGGRADEWSLDARLPRPLATLDADAGFHRPSLTARSLVLTSPSH